MTKKRQYPFHTMDPKNQYRVGKEQWNRWGDLAREVFNSTYEAMLNSQRLFLHPKATAAKDECWKTTAWNAAWIAADNLQETLQSWAEQ